MLNPEAGIEIHVLQATVLCVQYGAFSNCQAYRQRAERQLLLLPSVCGTLHQVTHVSRMCHLGANQDLTSSVDDPKRIR